MAQKKRRQMTKKQLTKIAKKVVVASVALIVVGQIVDFIVLFGIYGCAGRELDACSNLALKHLITHTVLALTYICAGLVAICGLALWSVRNKDN